MWAEKHKRITLHTNQSEFKNENAKSGAGAAYSPVFQSFELSAGVFFLVSGLVLHTSLKKHLQLDGC